MLKQSFCLPCFHTRGEPLRDLMKEAASIGYKAVEMWGPDGEISLEQVHEEARSAGLTVCSFTGHDSIDNGLNAPTHWQRIETELHASIDRAARLGVPGIICFAGTRRPGQSDFEGLDQFVAAAKRIVPYAEEKGVNLNLEILNSRLDHPLYMADTVDWAISACKAVDSPRMKLLFDVYHVQIMEGDLIKGLRRAAPYLGHIHTAGVPGRHELDDDQEINYRAIGRELIRLKYDAYVGHELFAKGDKTAALRSSFERLSNMSDKW